ncbi:MAG TPA: alcohol dehydrogenase, partial [Dehalococcoidia bacterium]|nr:alcohol dehydrogenase [Dehalococcoidia bacterium]
MKAAVLREVDRPLEVEEVEIDRPGPREVLIRTGATGVCHSDLHFVEGKYSIPMPAVLGHEAAGTIEAVGDQVTYVKPGDRVITCLSVFCGHCDRCLSGRPALCRRPDVDRPSSDPPRLHQG